MANGCQYLRLVRRPRSPSDLACCDRRPRGESSGLHLPPECLEGYWSVLHQGITAYGIPVALYVDRHTIFRSPKADKLTIDEELAGEKPSTRLGRAVAELGISLTFARSPQAKGRIERLWETLQDRLTHELRLHRISTLEAANAFLRAFVERFNARFAVEPESPEPAYRPLAPHHDLHRILCHRAWRKVSPGQTISWKGQTYRIAPAQHHEALVPRSTVEVRVTANGELWIAAGQGRLYRLEPCPKSPTAHRREDATPTPSPQPYKPPADHPWRRMPLGRPKTEASDPVCRGNFTVIKPRLDRQGLLLGWLHAGP